MIWKCIGQSVIGTSHTGSGKGCEDAVCYKAIPLARSDEALIGFVSDGAGSAMYAAMASAAAVRDSVAIVERWLHDDVEIDETHLLQLVETVYDTLSGLAHEQNAPLSEFSCTLLGFVILPERACFLQIGDGAIVRNDGSGYFTHLWWPHNGEYQNTTSFLVDDPHFRNLNTKIIEEPIGEIAMFTDGLQMLALNNESETVHQPFFTGLFKWLRMTTDAEHVAILDGKLTEYLGSATINSRTDDDKTLLLATRLQA